MGRTKVIRGLRIAWTAFFGVVCVLLVVLWGRSERLADVIGYGIDFPIWLAVLLTASPTVASLLTWRFSLRTLLFATTLIAVVLGLVVWVTNVEKRRYRPLFTSHVRSPPPQEPS